MLKRVDRRGPERRVPLASLVVAATALVTLPPCAFGQSVALLRGSVVDPLAGAIAAANVRLVQPLTGLERRTETAGDGTFLIANVPPDAYRLHVEFPGFLPHAQHVDLHNAVPVELRIILLLPAQEALVTVTPDLAALDTASAGTRHQVSGNLIAQMPVTVGSRGLESVLVTFPGFAQNANGAIHPRGAHNQMTFVVDGLPISDQLTGAFASALDAAIVERAEVITGHVPAEFGSKVSGIAVVTSRSGLGVNRSLTGDVLLSAAGFDTWQTSAQAGGGRQRSGYFGSVTAMGTDRFLDQVSLDNLHNAGHFVRGFGRYDYQATPSDMIRVHGMGGRSRFEVANLRSQEEAGQAQRQHLADAAVWGSYLRTLDPRSTLEIVSGYRHTNAALDPSDGDTPVTAAQRRDLSTLTLAARYTAVVGAHDLRAGIDVQRFSARERFSMAITSASFNDPNTADFNPALLPHDLTRGGSPFVFDEAGAGGLLGGFVQSTVRTGLVTWSLGLRYDAYGFLVDGRQWQPRVGLNWQLPGEAGILRASYNRNYQTPPNENLLLSSSPEAAALAPESVRQALGETVRPIRPERQHVFEMGWQTGLGKLARVDVSVYRKDSQDQQDNNNFFDTGVIFPTTLAALQVTGAEMRLTVPRWRDLSGTLSVTAGKAVATPPFTGGLFLGQDAVDLLSSGPFRIDHDQELGLHATVQYDPPSGFWVGSSVRYDSGLVANPSDPAEVAADPDFADLLPYVDLEAEVPRVRPRTVTDIVAGYDIGAGTKRTWSIQLQVTNLTNTTALYNFQSVFVGTRLVQPRTIAVKVKRFF